MGFAPIGVVLAKSAFNGDEFVTSELIGCVQIIMLAQAFSSQTRLALLPLFHGRR